MTNADITPDTDVVTLCNVIYLRWSATMVGTSPPDSSSTVNLLNWINNFMNQLLASSTSTSTDLVRTLINILGAGDTTEPNSTYRVSGLDINRAVTFASTSTISGMAASGTILQELSDTFTSAAPNIFTLPAGGESIAARRIRGWDELTRGVAELTTNAADSQRPTVGGFVQPCRKKPTDDFVLEKGDNVSFDGTSNWTITSQTVGSIATYFDLSAANAGDNDWLLFSGEQPCSTFFVGKVGTGPTQPSVDTGRKCVYLSGNDMMALWHLKVPAAQSTGTDSHFRHVWSGTAGVNNTIVLKGVDSAQSDGGHPYLEVTGGPAGATNVDVIFNYMGQYENFHHYRGIGFYDGQGVFQHELRDVVITQNGSALGAGDAVMAELRLVEVLECGPSTTSVKSSTGGALSGTLQSDAGNINFESFDSIFPSPEARNVFSCLRSYHHFLRRQGQNGLGDAMEKVYEAMQTASDTYVATASRVEWLTPEFYATGQQGISASTLCALQGAFAARLPGMIAIMAGDDSYAASLGV